jgi:hypothetical protein
VRRLLGIALLVVIAGCSTGTETTLKPAGWHEVSAPVVNGATDEVIVRNSRINNGTYWTWVERVLGTDSIVFHVAQARFGATCEAWAKDNGMTEGCMDDYAIDEYQTSLVGISNTAKVTVAFQESPGKSFEITTLILKQLISGTATVPISKYQWVSFPFISRIENNTIVDAQQMWVP